MAFRDVEEIGLMNGGIGESGLSMVAVLIRRDVFFQLKLMGRGGGGGGE